MIDAVHAPQRRLTDSQRQLLSRSAEWRALQLEMVSVYAYLGLMQLEDIQMQAVTEALQGLSQRLEACLERFFHHQGGM